jgi:hypothetical protein
MIRWAKLHRFVQRSHRPTHCFRLFFPRESQIGSSPAGRIAAFRVDGRSPRRRDAGRNLHDI